MDAPDTYLREGRAIRRLVCIGDPITALIAEHERRVILMMMEPEDLVEMLYSTDRERDLNRSYQSLVKWCPSVAGLVQHPINDHQLAFAIRELKRGSDRARADDTTMLKSYVAKWLNEQDPVPVFDLNMKEERGFNHSVTGRLLCPVDYNWSDMNIRQAIRHNDIRYPVDAFRWPTFLYRNGEYNPAAPSEGLFKGELLLRAFRCVFTSPSSAHADGAMPLHPPTRRNVATLLGMHTVQPRAIAYVAAQLRFALSTHTSWSLHDNNFDYELFYNNIVDWFEKMLSEARAREVEALLHWWNHLVFGHAPLVALQPNAALSVALSMA